MPLADHQPITSWENEQLFLFGDDGKTDVDSRILWRFSVLFYIVGVR